MIESAVLQTVVQIVQHGSPKYALQAETLHMFSVCVNDKIRLEPEWIPRQQNELADYFSCIIVDFDDYILNPSMFGPHQLELMFLG